MAAGVMYPTMQDANDWGESVSQTRGMFMGTPEIYFAKRIDNSRVVRTVDPKRSREMKSFGVTLAVFFILVMVYLLQHLSAIEYGYRIEQAKAEQSFDRREQPGIEAGGVVTEGTGAHRY